MRRFVAALVTVMVALSVTACGGGASTPPPAAPAPDAAAPGPAGAPAPAPVANTNSLSPREAGIGTPFPTSEHLPVAIVDLAKRHQPMLVYFFDPSQLTSADQRTEIDAAMKEFRGLIDLVAFDVTGALPGSSKQASKDPVAQQVALLTQDLNVTFTPTVVLVDKQGKIVARYSGFVDRGLLRRETLKATQ